MHRVACAVREFFWRRSVIAALLTLLFLEVVLTNQAFSANSEIDLLKQSWEVFNSPETEGESMLDGAIDGTVAPLGSLTANTVEGADSLMSPATSIVVSSAEELASALSQIAQTGGEIVLNPGEYGSLSLKNYNPSAAVVLRSADAENAAQISDILLRDSSNLVFDGFEIGRALEPGEPTYARMVNASNVTDVTFMNNEVHGSVDGDYNNDGFGFVFGNSSGIVLDNNEIHNLFRAIVVGTGEDIEVTNNYIHDMRSEGVNMAGVKNVLIDGNYMTDFHPNVESGDHADFIQFWTTGAGNSSDVTIRNNALIEGSGGSAQGIFIENDIPGNFYSNFNIEGNLYHGTAPNGIIIDDMQGGSIVNNTAINDASSASLVNIALEGDTQGVVVANNVSTSFRHPELATVFDNNITVHYDNLDSSFHGENLFVNVAAGESLTVADLAPRADGLLAQNGAGALIDSVLDLAILSKQQSGTSNSLTVDLNVMDYDFLESEAVTYRWAFSDGHNVEGQSVSHSFSTGGSHSVVLEVVGADGQILRSTDKVLNVVDPQLISLDFENGLADLQLAGREGVWSGSEAYMQGESGAAASFDGQNPSSIVIEDSSSLRGMSELTIQMDVLLGEHDYATSKDAQRILWYHGNYGVEIVNEETVNFHLWLENDSVKLTAKTSSMLDDAFHTITMSYSSDAGALVAYLDGVEIGRLDGLSGNVANNSGPDLILGSGPFRAAYDGAIDNVMISQSYFEPNATKVQPTFQEGFEGENSGHLEINEIQDFVSYENAALYGTAASDDEFSIFFDMKADSTIDDKQRLLWNHLEYGVSVEHGDLVFWMFNDDGYERAIVKDAGVDDGEWHQIGFTLDEETGAFVGYVDGKVTIEMENTGAELSAKSYWDVNVGGTPWGKTFMGDIDNLTAFAEVIDPDLVAMETNANIGSFETDLLVA